MNFDLLIERIRADGIRLALSQNGTIKATGEQGAINRWLPIIQKQKPGIIAALQEGVNAIIMEPAAANARPIYWERACGYIVGPATPEWLAKVGNGVTASFWVVCQFQGMPIWVNSTRLRNKRQFELQIKPMVVELIKELR